ncbi:hypothetical protein DPEC_G00170990 [Dallia pectoralis]|uniref:Uncharacterized protein n=1 Tax=Dallia pectoralis TaxID=75939 RepID=A0ACC2GD50_DALPE|nr:hypothetical protein DPEC_G00170990 [Dallia pectoralis]
MIWRTTGSVLMVFLWSLTVVLGQNGWSVIYSTQSISALKGSTVELSCSYTYPTGTVISTFWYRKYDRHNNPLNLIEDPDYKDRVTYHISDTNNHKVIIKDLRKSDSVEYMFRIKKDVDSWTGHPGVTLTVKDDWIVIYSTQSICVLKGSTVDLSCSYTYPSGSVTDAFWFTKYDGNNNPVKLSEVADYRNRVENRDEKYNHSLTITDLRETDSAEYWFRFITDQPGGKYYGKPGVTLSVTDLQVQMTPATVTEGQSVTLTCITSCTLTGQQRSVRTSALGITVIILALILSLVGFIFYRKKASKLTADDGQGDSLYPVRLSRVVTSTTDQTADTTDIEEENSETQ